MDSVQNLLQNLVMTLMQVMDYASLEEMKLLKIEHI